MKTIAVVIGHRPEAKFRKAVSDLKSMRFDYNAACKEWYKPVGDEYVESCLKQLKEAGLQAYIKENQV